MTQAITLYRRGHEHDPNFNYMFSLFLIFATRPTKESAEIDGSYFIGDVGTAKEKDWERLTPYSLAQKREDR